MTTELCLWGMLFAGIIGFWAAVAWYAAKARKVLRMARFNER